MIERGAVEGQIFHRGAVVELAQTERRRAAAAGLVRKELIHPDARDARRRPRVPVPASADPRRGLRRAAEGDARRPARAVRGLARAARARADRARRGARLPPRAGRAVPARARARRPGARARAPRSGSARPARRRHPQRRPRRREPARAGARAAAGGRPAPCAAPHRADRHARRGRTARGSIPADRRAGGERRSGCSDARAGRTAPAATAHRPGGGRRRGRTASPRRRSRCSARSETTSVSPTRTTSLRGSTGSKAARNRRRWRTTTSFDTRARPTHAHSSAARMMQQMGPLYYGPFTIDEIRMRLESLDARRLGERTDRRHVDRGRPRPARRAVSRLPLPPRRGGQAPCRARIGPRHADHRAAARRYAWPRRAASTKRPTLSARRSPNS